jgi:glycosyltransferase involved in cell wall biosynthesis
MNTIAATNEKEKTIRVGFFLPLVEGGCGNSVVERIKALAELDSYRLWLVTSDVREKLCPDGVKTYRLPSWGTVASMLIQLVLLPALVIVFGRVVNSLALDVVIGHSTLYSIALIIAKQCKVVPSSVVVIASEHSYPSICVSIRQVLVKKLVGLFYGGADRVFPVSRGLAEELNSVLGDISESKIRLVRNGFDLDRIWQSGQEEVPSPWPDGKRRLLFVGRLTPQKDLPLLLLAFSKLEADLNAYLVIVGGGPLYRQVKNAIAEMGLADRVMMLGHCANPYPYLRMCEVVVVTSAWETFCNVVVEALSFGKIVVSTRCKWGPEEILEDRWGALCGVGDSDGCASAIRQALTAPNEEWYGQPAIARSREFGQSSLLEPFSAYIKEVVQQERAKVHG